MIDPNNVPDVDGDEIVARFVITGASAKSLKNLVRANKTVKPQLFIPYPHRDVSVNRHRDCDEAETWAFGAGVAQVRQKTLHGRSDISVESCSIDPLSVIAKPIKDDPEGVPDNPNHADIIGFPALKADQKSFALKLAAAAGDCQSPPS